MSGFVETCRECMHDPHFAGCKTGEIARLRAAIAGIAAAARMHDDHGIEYLASEALADQHKKGCECLGCNIPW